MKAHFTCTARSHCKFYTMELAQSLFGPAVIRTWGRIGTIGRMRVDVYETWDDARGAFLRRCTERVKRGYEQEGEHL